MLAAGNYFLGTRFNRNTVKMPMRVSGFASAVLSLACLSSVRAADLDKLRLLYVGEPTNSIRAKQVTAFLAKSVAQIKAVDRHGFSPEQAEAFDVVLLDWP